jgi:hypothetical protein
MRERALVRDCSRTREPPRAAPARRLLCRRTGLLLDASTGHDAVVAALLGHQVAQAQPLSAATASGRTSTLRGSDSPGRPQQQPPRSVDLILTDLDAEAPSSAPRETRPVSQSLTERQGDKRERPDYRPS